MINKIRETFPLRIIKTSLALLISLLLAPTLSMDRLFAGIGSLKSMRESLTLSLQSLLEQLLANFIGFAFAITYSFLFGLNPFSITFALFSLFIVIKQTSLNETYLTSAFTMLAIMLLSHDNTEIFHRAFDRFFSTLFGMSIALFINATIFPPKKSKELHNILYTINEFIHIYLYHFEEYAYIELSNNAALLDKELSLISQEKNAWIISKNKKTSLNEDEIEIEIVKAQLSTIFYLETLDVTFRDLFIEILVELNFIQQYAYDDLNSIQDIKSRIRSIYFEHTDNSNFFTNTQFLSLLNIYINLLRDN